MEEASEYESDNYRFLSRYLCLVFDMTEIEDYLNYDGYNYVMYCTNLLGPRSTSYEGTPPICTAGSPYDTRYNALQYVVLVL